MTFLLTIIVSILIFGILIFVHELGHFLAAKLMGIKVNEFALGFGNTIWHKQYKGTVYKLNLFPLGGYVSLDGERGAEVKTEDNYRAKPLYAKLIVLFAGVFMNFVLAVLLLAIYLSNRNYTVTLQNVSSYDFIGTQEIQNLPATALVTAVQDDSPAKGKIDPNVFIIKVDGQTFADSQTLQRYLQDHRGQSVSFTILNELEAPQSDVSVVLNPDADKPALGIEYVPTPSFYNLKYPANIFSAVPHALNVFGYQIAALGHLISTSVQERNAEPLAENVTSVVGVSSFVGTLIDAHAFNEIINLAAIVSLSLAFVNIIPFPVLDGGQALIEIIEKIRRKPLNEKLVDRITQVTFIALMALGVVVILKDVFQTGLAANFVEGISKALGR